VARERGQEEQGRRGGGDKPAASSPPSRLEAGDLGQAAPRAGVAGSAECPRSCPETECPLEEGRGPVGQPCFASALEKEGENQGGRSRAEP